MYICKMFYNVYLFLTLVAVTSGHFTSQVGKCVCRVHGRCVGTEERYSRSCETSASYDGWGTACCKPFCTCKSECGPGESDEGQYGIPAWVSSNQYYMMLWEMANGGTSHAMGSCEHNQTFCCPICACRETCNVADTPVQDCGDNHTMCCDITRQVNNCDVNHAMLGTKDNRNECGKCSCQRECSATSVTIMTKRCVANQTLCCNNCSCKPSCDVTEIDKTTDMSTNQCGEGLRMCCASCKCKPQCQRGEEERGAGECYMTKRCCDTGLV